MRNTNSPLSPETWLNDLFTSKAVTQGGAIRRKRRDIERFAGLEPSLNEIIGAAIAPSKTRGRL